MGMTRTWNLALALLLALAPEAWAQGYDSSAARRQFQRDTMQGDINRLERESLRGELDAFGRRDLLERRSAQDQLRRDPSPDAPGPYRAPSDGSILLQSPPDPITGR